MQQHVITPELVRLDQPMGNSPEEVIEHLALLLHEAGRASSASTLAEDAKAREAKSPTGVPGGVAIPHCRSEAVSTPTLGFARLDQPVDFGGPDGAADLVFLIAAPAGGGKEHLKLLSKLARALVRKEFLAALRDAEDPAAIVSRIDEVLGNGNAQPKATAAAAPSNDAESGTARTKILAITACPTGIAHTYMAADALSQAADGMDNVELHVETQGSSSVTPFAPEVIEAADAVIFATDVGVKDRERFANLPVVESGVKRAINEPKQMIEEAIAAASNPQARRVQASTKASSSDAGAEQGLSTAKKVQQAVMTGVSYMVPFVAAGGLLLALGFLIGGYDMAGGWKVLATDYSLGNLPGHEVMVDGELMRFDRAGLALYLGAVLFATGQMAMGFIVAALSGYIAYALAGRPGIAPGFVGGAVSVMIGAGFIGGLVTGLLAGVVAMWLGQRAVPRVVASLMPVVIIPLLTSLVVGLAMFLLLGRPLAGVMTGLQDWLGSMSGSSAVLLGIILGLMMCFDLGGPVNKAAYLFATAGLSTGDDSSMKIMAAVMAAGMVPPIALSLATLMRKHLFTPAEQENGKSAWLLGLSFVSEGAIPFAAADPFRVIPSMMVGGAVTGAISMATGTTSRAPHGGIFVLFAIHPLWGFLLALVAGTITSAVLVVAAKQFWPNKALEASARAQAA
ncbi:PTS fructose transporter subunit IIABC [Corynebacterium pelargi]|uniref:PTS system fructose-specific EIIABC component n=1 Tax=Corynebacterium pelargi TaxID=1471400 RepID=A0A410W8D1_9CORY|nr:fructose-specific PTS transporter subunit EIIC [Corynebacterium pelargi]QAU52214.1 PTS system fructose-specific EIIABC component [Corynebacterium pelargi]GGG69309.1 phosphotransferase system, fructose-specific IIC component [Corynebacterium pelargi]